MALNVLGRFQTKDFTYWKGMTKDNHLGALYGRNPQKAADFMVQLLGVKRGRTLELMISSIPTKEFENDEEYYWDVVGSSYRNIPLVEARNEDGDIVTEASGMVGAGTAPFYLVFAEDWFADGEYIVGELNELYQFRILGNPRMEGTNAVYKVELAGGNTEGVPAERLLSGERFSIEAAFVEAEMSRKVGDVRFASPVSMRNEFSHIRIQHKVPGNKLNKKLAVGIPFVDKMGKKVTDIVWMHHVDYKVEEQFSDYKNNALAFGRSNRNVNGEYTNVGKSGNVIKTGAGLYQQIEVANTHTYNHFSLKLLENALFDLCANKLDLNERKFVIRTGQRGAYQFHKAVRDTISGWTEFSIDAAELGIIKKTTSPLHENALSAGYQYTEFKAPNGITVSLEVDPYYDDEVRNKIMHPEGGPAFSYRYDIMDLGSSEQPNIFKCSVRNMPEMRGYEWGPFANPFNNQTNNNFASFDEDSAVIHKKATLGICVLDPTRTLSLIPSILVG